MKMQIWNFLLLPGLLSAAALTETITDDPAYDGSQQRLPPVLSWKMFLGLGPKNDRHVSRIIGGKEVNIGNFRHQLSLRKMGVHICGASVIG
jgi:hypothetical protein